MVSFTLQPLYPQGKSPWYPLDRRVGGPQSQSGRGGLEKNSQLPPGIEPLPVVLYMCENWSVTLRGEHRLKVCENRVLRRIYLDLRQRMEKTA
jgi:hypothetical protein